MAKVKKNVKVEGAIPTCSMADIAFLLLIFFIVSTVFVKERGLRVNLPRAESIDKIPRIHAVTVYVDRSGSISIDDFMVDIPMVYGVMQRKKMEDFNMIVCFRTDTDTEYGVMADIMNQMRRAEALRVSFEAKLRGR
ncbi:MAG: biopolymer transporter ExbD [Candidatus Cloacimonetes bacterium]|nr:biopolymer transporter ExbD [Candidatus Cloacimonadota bacterium]